MKALYKKILADEAGFIVSAELVLVGTIAVTGLVVGLTEVRNAMVNELADVSESIGSLDQSYRYSGFIGCRAITAGSCYVDHDDDCSEVDFCHAHWDHDRSTHRHDGDRRIERDHHHGHNDEDHGSDDRIDDGHGHHHEAEDDHHRDRHHEHHHHRRFRPEGNCDDCLESRPRLYDVQRHHKHHRGDHDLHDEHEHGIVPEKPLQPELPKEVTESEEGNSV